MTTTDKATEHVDVCRICGSPHLEQRFWVAFPEFCPDFSHAWPLDTEPPVPAWKIVACRTCGVHFPNPFPSRDEILAFYGSQLQHNEWEAVHYVEETADRSEAWAAFADKLTRLVGEPGAALEIGPAAGHLLKALRDRGWSAVGVEAAPKFTRILEERGLPHHAGDLASFPDGDEFDLVVGIDVVEHLHDPVADLRRCAELLKPGGKVVIATCDIGSLAARYYGLRWRQLVISHTFYWTRESLRIALRRGGFDLDDVSSFRWWDPSPAKERLAWVREFGKLLVRQLVHRTWVAPARRFPAARAFQQRHSRFDRFVEHSIGDQPVMSEVILVVGTRAG